MATVIRPEVIKRDGLEQATAQTSGLLLKAMMFQQEMALERQKYEDAQRKLDEQLRKGEIVADTIAGLRKPKVMEQPSYEDAMGEIKAAEESGIDLEAEQEKFAAMDLGDQDIYQAQELIGQMYLPGSPEHKAAREQLKEVLAERATQRFVPVAANMLGVPPEDIKGMSSEDIKTALSEKRLGFEYKDITLQTEDGERRGYVRVDTRTGEFSYAPFVGEQVNKPTFAHWTVGDTNYDGFIHPEKGVMQIYGAHKANESLREVMRIDPKTKKISLGFATNKEIIASRESDAPLQPTPKGSVVRVGPDGTMEMITGTATVMRPGERSQETETGRLDAKGIAAYKEGSTLAQSLMGEFKDINTRLDESGPLSGHVGDVARALNSMSEQVQALMEVENPVFTMDDLGLSGKDFTFFGASAPNAAALRTQIIGAAVTLAQFEKVISGRYTTRAATEPEVNRALDMLAGGKKRTTGSAAQLRSSMDSIVRRMTHQLRARADQYPKDLEFNEEAFLGTATPERPNIMPYMPRK